MSYPPPQPEVLSATVRVTVRHGRRVVSDLYRFAAIGEEMKFDRASSEKMHKPRVHRSPTTKAFSKLLEIREKKILDLVDGGTLAPRMGSA